MSQHRRRLPISDVALGAGGQLTGWVVDAEGRPVGQTPVVLFQNGHHVAQAMTDARGQIPYCDLFASDKVLQGGIVAGATAIPVAIYNNHRPGS